METCKGSHEPPEERHLLWVVREVTKASQRGWALQYALKNE